MIAVMSSKWVADSLYPDGIYVAWISLHDYPFLPTTEFRDKGDTAADHMRPVTDLKVIDGRRISLRELEHYANNNHDIHGFPVVVDGLLLGYAARDSIQNAIGPSLTASAADGITLDSAVTHCTFIPNGNDRDTLDLSTCLTSTCMRLRQGTPLEIVVRLFQSLNLSFVLFTSMGRLTGMMSRHDVTRLFNTKFEYTGALVDDELARYRDGL